MSKTKGNWEIAIRTEEIEKNKIKMHSAKTNK
jgi:hypothetical protein